MIKIKPRMYKYIGSGSSRKVFDLGNGYVAKIAKNRAGIAQNKTEYRISTTSSSNLFAEVIEISKDSSTLIMKKADKIYDVFYVCRYFKVKSITEVLELKQFQDLHYRYNLLLKDLRRPSNWGIINKRPVIIDYGFTKEVSRKYY